jgi:hypothetical protein
MPRKVNGFLTKTGHYFDTKLEAEQYEAVYDVNEAIEALLRDSRFVGFNSVEYMRQRLRAFLIEQHVVVQRYTSQKYLPDLPELPDDEPIPPSITGDLGQADGDGAEDFMDAMVRSASESET